MVVEKSRARTKADGHGRVLLRSVLLGVVLVAVALAVGWRSLDYGWYWDDLHLVRPYSATEIARSFVGTWDPDGIETRGFRPGTVIFDHVQFRLFGESVRAHRVFLIVLLSIYLVSLGRLAERFGAPSWVALLAGLLTLCSKNTFYHYVWIGNGVGMVPALLFVAAAHLLITYLDMGTRSVGALSAGLVILAVVTREEAVMLWPVLLVMGLTYLRLFERPREAYVRLGRYGAWLAISFLPLWVWRVLMVPGAPDLRLGRQLVEGPLTHFLWTVCLSGQSGTAPIWFLAVFAFLLATAAGVCGRQRLPMLMWLVLAAVTCAPGAVMVRTNLLLLPISFYAVFVSLAVAAIARTSRATAAVAMAVLVMAAAVSARASRLEQLALHPMSTDYLFRNWEALYRDRRFASIPPDRASRSKAHLARFGMVDGTFDFERWMRDLRRQGRVGMTEDGGPFVPEKHFLTP